MRTRSAVDAWVLGGTVLDFHRRINGIRRPLRASTRAALLLRTCGHVLFLVPAPPPFACGDRRASTAAHSVAPSDIATMR